MKLPSLLHSTLLVSLLSAAPFLRASPAADEVPAPEVQIVSGLTLPYWEEGECRENFDVRIWPRPITIWLEEENLRSLIADPATPELERQSLKRVLALQR